MYLFLIYNVLITDTLYAYLNTELFIYQIYMLCYNHDEFKLCHFIAPLSIFIQTLNTLIFALSRISFMHCFHFYQGASFLVFLLLHFLSQIFLSISEDRLIDCSLMML